MSDSYLRLIPTDPGWRPDDVALRRAVRVLRELVPEADRVRGRQHEGVVFVDAGSNAERVDCPACGAELAEDWWAGRLDRAGRPSAGAFTDLAVTTPCCETRTTLNDLDYVWPAGFATAVVEARNPGRGWLTPDERARVEQALGHPLREVRTGS
jgi:DNA-directed RNA polymerase subunit N (RpoN/RPB10)